MEHKRFYSKRYCTTSLAETVANTEELLTEILVRVPTKPLVRFKCVSKHWLSLISEPRFRHLHTLQNPNPPVLAVFCDTAFQPFGFIPLDLDHIRGTSSTTNNTSNHENQISSRSTSPPFNPLRFAQNQHHDHIRIIQSCNGLFLCRLFHSQDRDPPYFIFNPTTNQFSTIIPPPATVVTTATGEQIEPFIISIALAFDPSKSPHYKLVCLRTIDGSEYGKILQIVMYSSETQSWRLLDSTMERIFTISYRMLLYWNGAINWLGMYGEVAYFHIDDERDDFIDNPPYLYEKDNHKRQNRYFRESGDGCHLHLIDIYRPYPTKFEVLEMGRDYSGWYVKYHVDLDPLCSDFPYLDIGRFVVLFIDRDKNEDEDSSSLLLHTFCKLVSYNLKNKTFKSFEITPKAEVDVSQFRVGASNHRYVETLACV